MRTAAASLTCEQSVAILNPSTARRQCLAWALGASEQRDLIRVSSERANFSLELRAPLLGNADKTSYPILKALHSSPYIFYDK